MKKNINDELAKAVKNSSLKEVKLALSNGACIDAVSVENNDSILLLAVLTIPESTDPTQAAEIVTFLLEMGADPNIKNKDGVGPVAAALKLRLFPLVFIMTIFHEAEIKRNDFNETDMGVLSSYLSYVQTKKLDMLKKSISGLAYMGREISC